MTKYIPAFGVEIHAELKTKTKAFSPAEINFDAEPNTLVHPVDIGYPGSKPTVNIKMVEYAYRLAKVLRMDIEPKIYFDRKSYFYPDLPKGFQITQYFKPIGKNGKLRIELNNGDHKDISITEIHMEEDTAKQIKTNDGVLYDFNRSGVPLIEIVSGHEELENIDEVIAFVKQLKEQLVIMGINDGKMEEGSFRVDVNVSIRKEGQKEYGIRTEVKNLNSFNNIRKALEVEIERHKSIYDSGNIPESMTVRFDEDKEITIPMRKKDSSIDYNFIPEGNIRPIVLTNELTDEWNKNNYDYRIFEVRKILKKNYQANSIDKILTSRELFDWVWEETDYKLFDYLQNNNLIDILKDAAKEDRRIVTSMKLKIKEKLNKLIKFRSEGKINSSKTNELISKLFKNDADEEIKKLENKVMMSDDDIKNIVIKIIENNNELIEKEKNDRPEKLEKMIMGQLMKETKGQASPQSSMKIVKEVLWAE